MDVDANDLLLFARVVKEGSFSRAALRLGLPKSTVSRRLAALESRLGERLLLRTTRKLSVTEFGRGILEHAQQVVSEVEAATALAQHRQAEPTGRLRISMPADFANLVLGPLLARFIAEHPRIALELDLSARRVDLIGENFDLAIRMGELADDATLAARRLAVFSAGLYAAPAYLARRGMPAEPEALMEHDALCLLGAAGAPAPWMMARGEQRWEGGPPCRAAVNSPELLMRMARLGAGITRVEDYFAEPHVQAGELVAVLPDWSLPAATAWAVFPGRRLMPARLRVFLDALAAEFSEARCMEAQLQARQARQERLAQAARTHKSA